MTALLTYSISFLHVLIVAPNAIMVVYVVSIIAPNAVMVVYSVSIIAPNAIMVVYLILLPRINPEARYIHMIILRRIARQTNINNEVCVYVCVCVFVCR